MLLLKINKVLYKSVSTGLALSLAFSSLSCLSFIKLLSLKINMLFVYILTTLNTSVEVVINKHRSYNKVFIPSLV